MSAAKLAALGLLASRMPELARWLEGAPNVVAEELVTLIQHFKQEARAKECEALAADLDGPHWVDYGPSVDSTVAGQVGATIADRAARIRKGEA